MNETPSATVFLDNVIFYSNGLGTLISDAKFALPSCHFKSGAHHYFARDLKLNHVLATKPEENYGNAYDFNHFRTSC